MKNDYSSLQTFNLGKHVYVIIKNDEKIMYFEVVNDEYVLPVTSFNLFDNEGKSLTIVNQHFFMSQLVERLNLAHKKEILDTDEELSKYLSDMKSKIEIDAYLKKLFKGTFMGEINEESFENNKKELISYLDKFRFDTFVDYNNVSIFDGNLLNNAEKGVNEVAHASVSNADLNKEALINDAYSVDSDNNSDNSDISFESFEQNASDLDSTNAFDFKNDDSFESDNFGVSKLDDVQESLESSALEDNTDNNNFSNDINDNSSSLEELDNSNIDNASMSYLDQVKSRLESGNLKFNSDNNQEFSSELSVNDNNTLEEVSEDKALDNFNVEEPVFSEDSSTSSNISLNHSSQVNTDLNNELVSNDELSDDVIDNSEDVNLEEKISGKVIALMVILVIVLIIFSFILYNYVF